MTFVPGPTPDGQEVLMLVVTLALGCGPRDATPLAPPGYGENSASNNEDSGPRASPSAGSATSPTLADTATASTGSYDATGDWRGPCQPYLGYDLQLELVLADAGGAVTGSGTLTQAGYGPVSALAIENGARTADQVALSMDIVPPYGPAEPASWQGTLRLDAMSGVLDTHTGYLSCALTR